LPEVHSISCQVAKKMGSTLGRMHEGIDFALHVKIQDWGILVLSLKHRELGAY
jgi:hypothetical protein